jgi:hypothetical protein
MQLSRLEKRFLSCGNAIAAAEFTGNKVSARIARAEWQQCYNLLGSDRVQELLAYKRASKGA